MLFKNLAYTTVTHTDNVQTVLYASCLTSQQIVAMTDTGRLPTLHQFDTSRISILIMNSNCIIRLRECTLITFCCIFYDALSEILRNPLRQYVLRGPLRQ